MNDGCDEVCFHLDSCDRVVRPQSGVLPSNTPLWICLYLQPGLLGMKVSNTGMRSV